MSPNIIDERKIDETETLKRQNELRVKLASWETASVANLIAEKIREKPLFYGEEVSSHSTGIDGYMPNDTVYIGLRKKSRWSDFADWLRGDGSHDYKNVLEVVAQPDTRKPCSFLVKVFRNRIRDEYSVQEIVKIATDILKRAEMDGVLLSEVRIMD